MLQAGWQAGWYRWYGTQLSAEEWTLGEMVGMSTGVPAEVSVTYCSGADIHR
jgi:hypothetical protein